MAKLEISHTRLGKAITLGHVKNFLELIATGKYPLTITNMEGDNLLHLAISKEHYKICEILLNKMNAKTINNKKNGMSALEAAAGHGNEEIFNLLIINSKKPTTNKFYITCEILESSLFYAAINGHANIVKLLFINGVKGNLQVKDCFENLVSINQMAPLNIASFLGHNETAYTISLCQSFKKLATSFKQIETEYFNLIETFLQCSLLVNGYEDANSNIANFIPKEILGALCNCFVDLMLDEMNVMGESSLDHY